MRDRGELTHVAPVTTAMTPDLRIVIPAHNEALRIGSTIHDYCSHFAARAIVVVVANGCTDDTCAAVTRLLPTFENLQLIEIEARVGKGGAVRAGLMTGSEPYVGFVDADHSTAAAEFDRLFAACVARAADGVIASRWRKDSVVLPKQPLPRRAASRVFNALVRLLLRLPYADTQCGAKIFRRAAMKSLVASLTVADYAFDVDLLYAAHRAKLHISEESTVWADKYSSTVDLVPTSLRMFWAIVRLRMERSFISQIPYFEYLRPDSIIAVYQAPSILLLADGDASTDAVQHVVETLKSKGIVVERPPLAVAARSMARRVVQRAKVFAWYLLGSHRRYEAVIEVASGVPFLIPAMSAKRTFVMPGPMSRWSSTLYRALYRRSTYSAPNGDDLIEFVRFRRKFHAVFEQTGSDAWVLHVAHKDVSSTIQLG